MAEPGGKGSENAPMPNMKSMWTMLLVMMMIMVLYMIDGNDHVIGGLLNNVFQFIDFDGQYPVPTLMIMGAIMILLSSGLRTILTDTISQQKAQAYSSAFNKEMRQARLENNTYKLKKLQEMQPQIMAKSMESSTQMMKSMPLTMIVVVPIFLWVRYFVNVTLSDTSMRLISVPWALISQSGGIDLTASFVFPAWILIYSLISIPIGQIVMRLVRTYQFKKRLKEIESEAGEGEAA